MLRKTSFLLIAMSLAFSSVAYAALDRYEDTYELGLNEVQLPAYTGGNLVVRACADCEPVLRRVTSSTVYRIGSNGRDVSLRELREAAAAASGGALYVSYRLDTGDVNRIILSVWD